MNGRVYDYNLGRFMSVDPIIQAPGNSQSINPDSYIMNNPLAGTDPTGYCAAATGTRIKSCGDMKVEVKVTMKDGSSKTRSTVVKDVNFRNGADVSSAMGKGASSLAGKFSSTEIGSQKGIAEQKGNNGQNNSENIALGNSQGRVGIDWNQYGDDTVSKGVVDSWFMSQEGNRDSHIDEDSYVQERDYWRKNESRIAKRLMRYRHYYQSDTSVLQSMRTSQNVSSNVSQLTAIAMAPVAGTTRAAGFIVKEMMKNVGRAFTTFKNVNKNKLQACAGIAFQVCNTADDFINGSQYLRKSNHEIIRNIGAGDKILRPDRFLKP
jgi:hypothetical protein